MKYLNLLIAIAMSLIMISFYSCKKDNVINNENDDDSEINSMKDLEIEDSFNWETTKEVSINIETKTNDGQALQYVRLSIYDAYNHDENPNPKQVKLLHSGFTNANGVFTANIKVSAQLDSIFVEPNYIGLNHVAALDISSGSANYTFGNQITKGSTKSLFYLGSGKTIKSGKNNYLTLGSWNSSGVPNYLTTADVVTQSLLADINASLPEGTELPTSHPQYLASGNEANIVLQDSCDIWVTFVHEGAGYKNVLGFYTYNVNNPPSSVNDINNMTIAFPNVSFSGSGGGLNSGDKVYIGSFGAGTVIGWFIIANGYNSSSQSINGNAQHYYSNSNLNPETNASNKQHMVLLQDANSNKLIMGFEDLFREGYCDQDFNDAVFYATANPIEAVVTNDVPELDTPGDQDGDGVSDKFDDYPNDDTKAMNNYYPAENEFGTLAFEDLWPSQGDYDFNDLVLDYQFNSVTNGDNKIVEVKSKLVPRAIGAGLHNGFGFEMDLNPSDIASVTGQSINENYISLASNGVENSQTKATIIAFDDAYDVLQFPGGNFVNTVPGETYVTPDTLFIDISLNSPKTLNEVGSAPYNPFIMVNRTRGREVHLPGYPPTDLADNSLFGTGDDNTNLSTGVYYKTNGNLPWAMNLPSSFVYPKESSSIINGHLKFGQWAQSNGFSFMDWYEDKLGYRNNNNLYTLGN